MKWNHPKDGEKRIVKHFAFLPVRIKQESRWLETVYLLEEYLSAPYTYTGGYWFQRKFCSQVEYEHCNLHRKEVRKFLKNME